MYFFFLSINSYLQTIDMNRQIIVPPTNLNVSGNVSKSPITDIQYFPRPIKTIATISAQNATTVNPNETVNVVFRAPIVSSSSNQSMRPPPPPPPKLKGHSEEPSSSIPDLGKVFFSPFIHLRG